MGEKSEDEQRRDRALKRMLSTPPTPHVKKAETGAHKKAGEVPARDTSPARKKSR